MTEVADRHPQEWRMFLARDPKFRVPGGQSAEEHAREAITGLESLARAHGGQRIAVVTHGGVLGALLRHTLGIAFTTPRAFALPNGSLNVFRWWDRRWCLQTWGMVEHLETALSLGEAVG